MVLRLFTFILGLTGVAGASANQRCEVAATSKPQQFQKRADQVREELLKPDSRVPKDIRKNMQKAYLLSIQHSTQAWGYDENAKAIIVPPEILKKLEIPFEKKNYSVHGPDGPEVPVYSALIAHTYAYALGSGLVTPYGKKYDRWVQGHMAVGLGHTADHFTPWADQSEFAQNVLDETRKVIAGDAEHPIVFHLKENAVYLDPAGKSHTIEAHTRVVKLKYPEYWKGGPPNALLFTVKWNQDTEEKFMSIFPMVFNSFVGGILKEVDAQGEFRRGKYNLYIPSEFNHQSTKRAILIYTP